MREHEYRPDFDVPPEPHKLGRLCKCGLPRRNQVHVWEPKPIEDISDRIIGEGAPDE